MTQIVFGHTVPLVVAPSARSISGSTRSSGETQIGPFGAPSQDQILWREAGLNGWNDGWGLLRYLHSSKTIASTPQDALRLHLTGDCEMQHLTLPTSFKAASDTGRIAGYASTFGGEPDIQGDVIAPGAFVEVRSNASGKIPLLWQHNSREPIGAVTVEQDAKGLKFDGELVLQDDLAVKARAHVQAGSVGGTSIGFDVLENGFEWLKSGGGRLLKRLRLYEISIVTFPASMTTSVAMVKSRGDLEQMIRERLGLSRGIAKRGSFELWKIIQGGEPDLAPQDLLDVFNSIKL